jgi:cell division septum initiation protein DivIVA
MTEEQKPISVPEMLRMTGENTSGFMNQVADHIEKLVQAVADLKARVNEMESSIDHDNTTQ